MKYQELLTHFKLIPKNEIHTTIFSVAGYPHYENVCSNILAFYLNPNNNHKLGRLFFSALLESAGHTELIDEEFQVDREVCTDKQGRIDILIETNKSVIGIENKIYHTLNKNLS